MQSFVSCERNQFVTIAMVWWLWDCGKRLDRPPHEVVHGMIARSQEVISGSMEGRINSHLDVDLSMVGLAG
jgi:hypothetical protein